MITTNYITCVSMVIIVRLEYLYILYSSINQALKCLLLFASEATFKSMHKKRSSRTCSHSPFSTILSVLYYALITLNTVKIYFVLNTVLLIGIYTECHVNFLFFPSILKPTLKACFSTEHRMPQAAAAVVNHPLKGESRVHT